MAPDPTAGTGRLSVVGTPIGNLGDLSQRAAEVLATVDAVVCEDTRRTGKLLAHLGARRDGKPALLVANEHTEVPRLGEILDRLAAGEHLALVTDAGMPTVSDPGRHVVAAAVEHGHVVDVVPGPTAVSAALALSGLPVDRYVFEGFLPRKGRERTDRLRALAGEERAVVVYESPRRVAVTLADLASVCGGDRRVAVGRELTKLHEEVVRTTLAEAAERLARQEPRGEFVLVVDGRVAGGEPPGDDQVIEALRRCLGDGLSKRDAVAEVARRTGEPRRRIYELSITL
ncbi:MAG: 16S rRNA (cytidine(1402)-2'-O)-methyltransferase [Actinomycetota bacterium]